MTLASSRDSQDGTARHGADRPRSAGQTEGSAGRFLLLSTAVVLLALLLREWFVVAAWFPNPTAGDAGAYLRYAQHLRFDGVFSGAVQDARVVPDAFRSPGYPAIIALLWDGHPWIASPRWFSAIYQLQAFLGAATVACTIAFARLFLSRAWALAAGMALAVQLTILPLPAPS